MTEADVVWFSKRTKVFSQEVYEKGRESQRPHSRNSDMTELVEKTDPEDKKDKNEEDTFLCTVCFERVKDGNQAVILSCRHVLHCPCAEQWFKQR